MLEQNLLSPLINSLNIFKKQFRFRTPRRRKQRRIDVKQWGKPLSWLTLWGVRLCCEWHSQKSRRKKYDFIQLAGQSESLWEVGPIRIRLRGWTNQNPSERLEQSESVCEVGSIRIRQRGLTNQGPAERLRDIAFSWLIMTKIKKCPIPKCFPRHFVTFDFYLSQYVSLGL